MIVNEGAYYFYFYNVPHVNSFSWSDFQRQQCTQQTRYHRSSVPNRSWTSGLARYSTLGCRMEGSVPFSDLVLSRPMMDWLIADSIVLFCFMTQVLKAQSGDGGNIWTKATSLAFSFFCECGLFRGYLSLRTFHGFFFRKQLLARVSFFPPSKSFFSLFFFFFYLSTYVGSLSW